MYLCGFLCLCLSACTACPSLCLLFEGETGIVAYKPFIKAHYEHKRHSKVLGPAVSLLLLLLLLLLFAAAASLPFKEWGLPFNDLLSSVGPLNAFFRGPQLSPRGNSPDSTKYHRLLSLPRSPRIQSGTIDCKHRRRPS